MLDFFSHLYYVGDVCNHPRYSDMSLKAYMALSLGILVGLLIVEASLDETPKTSPQSDPAEDEDATPINIPAD